MKHTKCYIAGYPRPQLVRRNWQSLNGEWSFAFWEEVSLEDALAGKLPRRIAVPFSYETAKSGIGDPTPHEVVWYARSIGAETTKRTLLHFDGADYETEVYINGRFVGANVGAYARFSFDVTEFLTQEHNLLVVKCTDENRPSAVRGKQRWKGENFGCWYVQTTGIYKTVWLEFVDEVELAHLKTTPDIQKSEVRFDFSVSHPSEDTEVRFDISFDENLVRSVCVRATEEENSVTVSLPSEKLTYQVELWSVEHPALYDVAVTVTYEGKITDRVGSYFGLREYVAEDGKLLLNRMPFYARLLLDQGYWEESGLTPPDEEALVRDITGTKAMGFNGVRKHQKVEDERFFYYADILGFTVWCELPSNHWFSDDSSVALTQQWLKIVRQNYHYPSLVTWVIFNESWGVRNIGGNAAQASLACGLYYLTKSIDPIRPVISDDGWNHTVSDILTLHHYEQDGDKLYTYYDSPEKLSQGPAGHPLAYAKGFSYGGQPIVFSEFGGAAYVEDEANGWGYGCGVKNDEEFLSRFAGLVAAIGKMNICGYCYTQLTDVEQEKNGLLRADRTPKVPLSEIEKRNR